MSRIDARLSDCVAYGFVGGPEWSTLVVPLDNGQEIRNGQWMYPRHRYSAQFMNLAEEDRNEILAAFHVARGKLYAFRFKDWNDYTATDEPLLPEYSTTTAVQLTKTYLFGSADSVRIIRAVVSSVVKDASGTIVSGTLDAENGLFTPGAAWDEGSGPYTWSGEFDVWVRFDSDYNAFAIGNCDAHTADVDLVEVKA